MRSVNLVFMFAVTVISALAGARSLLTGINHYPNSVPMTASLVGLSLISFAYALLLLGHKAKGSAGQWLVLLLYLISAAAGTAACGILGTLPYVMKSMALSFGPALDYVYLPALTCAVPAVAALVVAVIYLRRRRAALRLSPGQ
ncbi:hypothetical protein ACLUTX_13165 [Enterobacterales bacterium AE_CKDN230030158-1A_HGKHYDSX7]